MFKRVDGFLSVRGVCKNCNKEICLVINWEDLDYEEDLTLEDLLLEEHQCPSKTKGYTVIINPDRPVDDSGNIPGYEPPFYWKF